MEVIEERLLSNGAVVTITDESTKMAADRWLVKFRCVTTIPWAEWMDQHVAEEAGLMGTVKESIEPISYEILRERNFIDEGEKDEIVASILSSLRENIEKYMQSSKFAQNCFFENLTKWREAKKHINLKVEEEMDDDNGPADFSACFK